MNVSELTDEHRGWQIEVADTDPMIRRRIFVLGEIRTWTYQGKTTVGLVDTSNAGGPWAGTERHYSPDTACKLIRQIKKRRQR